MDDETTVLGRIIDSLLEKNEGDVKTSIADFFSYLKENEMIISVIKMVFHDNYWDADCNVTYKGKRVCILSMNDVSENFIIDIVGNFSTEYRNIPIDENIKKIAWENINHCLYVEDFFFCKRCSRGQRKTIFDKEFDDVCRFVMSFSDMKTEVFECIKKLLEMRKTDILVDIKYNQYLDFG